MAGNSTDHDQRYERLQHLRISWFDRSERAVVDRSDIVIHLHGSECNDIPAFYLCLGRAVNGASGYYGCCLDSLDDCLCGGFGLVPPFTLRIHNADTLRENLGRTSLMLWGKSREKMLISDSDMRESELADLGIPFGDLPEDAPSYFQSVLKVFTDRDVTVLLC